MSENFKPLVLQDKCNIEIFLSPGEYEFRLNFNKDYLWRFLGSLSANFHFSAKELQLLTAIKIQKSFNIIWQV